MSIRSVLGSLAIIGVSMAPIHGLAEPIPFTVLASPSRATFKTDAPLETVVGNTAGPAVMGTVTVDPAKPQDAKGTIKVDLSTVKTGVDKRDADMRSKSWLDTDNEVNRYAVFDIKGVEIAGPLEPGREIPAKVKGVLTIRGKAVDLVVDARVTYVKLTPEQAESQKRFGFTSDNLRIRATFKTTFNNHGMQVPQLLFLKVSNDIQLETDLTLIRQ